MLGISETGVLFGLYLENIELSSEEFLEMMKGDKEDDELRIRKGSEECSNRDS